MTLVLMESTTFCVKESSTLPQSNIEYTKHYISTPKKQKLHDDKFEADNYEAKHKNCEVKQQNSNILKFADNLTQIKQVFDDFGDVSHYHS